MIDLEASERGAFDSYGEGVIWYIDDSRTPESTCSAVYGLITENEHSYALGKYSCFVFQAKMLAGMRT